MEDGTSCGPGTFDICVTGECRKAGCDSILNSNATAGESVSQSVSQLVIGLVVFLSK